MKTWKLVSGIISCILFAIVTMQSCAAGVAEAIASSDGTSGGTGLIVGCLMLAGGIVSIVVRKSKKNGGNIAILILFGLAALFGFSGYGIFEDLIIWSGWCLACAILAFISLISNSQKKRKKNQEETV